MRKYLHNFLVILLLISAACNKLPEKTGYSSAYREEIFQPVYHLDLLAESQDYLPAVSGTGTVDYAFEISGVVSGIYNANGLWLHNDGGNDSELFLCHSENGRLIAHLRLGNVNNLDWEDIAINQSLSDGGISYIYLADIGNNIGTRNTFSIYRFEEPSSFKKNTAQPAELFPDVREIVFSYPDGNHNAEAMFVDPITEDIFVITRSAHSSYVYRIPFSHSYQQAVVPERVGILPFGEVTGADISPDGHLITIRTYNHILLWKRGDGESISRALGRIPEKLPYNGLEPQGEAICFNREGYYTLSEKVHESLPQLFFYPRAAN